MGGGEAEVLVRPPAGHPMLLGLARQLAAGWRKTEFSAGLVPARPEEIRTPESKIEKDVFYPSQSCICSQIKDVNSLSADETSWSGVTEICR